MADATIDNPVINSPFFEPKLHFVMLDGKPTGEIDDRRRPSEFFVPVAQPKKKSAAQLTFDQFGPPTKQQPNEIVNEIRQAVARWRRQGYPHITTVSRDLLTYWRDEDRERRLFFCQIEALETAIYLAEVAPKLDTWIENSLCAKNELANAGLYRIAFKMATGSGKTVTDPWDAVNMTRATFSAESAAATLRIPIGWPVDGCRGPIPRKRPSPRADSSRATHAPGQRQACRPRLIAPGRRRCGRFLDTCHLVAIRKEARAR